MAKKEASNVIRLIIGTAFIISFFFVTNPPTQEVLGIYLFFLVISFGVYYAHQYQDNVIGISSKNLLKSFIWAIMVGALFYLITKFIPGMSLGLPLLPQSISEEMRFLVVILIAPVVEEIFFRGALMGYIRDFKPNKKWLWFAIIIQAIAFSLYHLGAYVSGWYSLPNFAVGLDAFWANFASFFSAFLFALLSGYIVSRDGIKNLVFCIVLHMLFNFIIYSTLTIGFAYVIPLAGGLI